MKIYTILLIISLWLFGLTTYAQQVTVKADTVIGTPGDSVTVSITVSNLNNVGSITLYLQYNAGEATFGKGKNWLNQFYNGFNFANAANGVVAITCLNYNGVTLSQGKLLDLTFKFTNGSSLLSFTANCEVTDINGVAVVPSPNYLNGYIAKKLEVNISPNTTICQGSGTTISVAPSGLFGNYSYQWASIPAGFSSTVVSPAVNPAVSTRYFVTVSSYNHSDTASVLITVINPGAPSAVGSMLPPNGIINVDNHVTLSWAPATGATSYDVYLWKSTDPQPGTPSYSNLSQISITLTSDLQQGTTYKWKVVSRNVCYQTAGPENQFTMRAFPDLHVTQVTTSSALAGQPIEISWTVKNDGNGPTTTPLWYDRIWISPDIEVRVGEPEHVLLGTVPNLSALAPGESYTQTMQFNLPPNLIGTYYIFVITDALDALFFSWPFGAPTVPYNPPPYAFAWTHGGSMVNVVQEATDNGANSDNFFYKEITLAVPPLPDLIVTDIQKPATIFSGQPTTINWSVKNQGQSNTLVNSWSDRVYLSQDTSLNPANAFTLATISHTGVLKIDSTYTASANVTIPNYISGPYFIYVSTDIFNQVFEHIYESNNTSRSDTLHIFLTPPPDLVVNNIEVPASASDKENISVKYSVMNQGATATTAGAWVDKIYLSQQPAFNMSQSQLIYTCNHYGNLPSFQQYSNEVFPAIPQNFTGPYYLFIKTDADNVVFEYSDTNNVTRSDTSILILSPDLVVSSISLPAADSLAEPLLISWYDKNQGPGKLISGSWMDKIYLSPNAVYDPFSLTLVDSLSSLAGILNGDSLNRVKTTVLPNVGDGDYFTYVVTDSKSQVYENINENNNIGRSNSTIHIMRPDLIVQALLFPASVQSGMPFSFTAILKNNGLGTILNKSITDRIYLSSSPVFNPLTAINLGSLVHTVTLHPQDTLHTLLTLNIPDGMTGPYYLVYLTDNTNVVKEGVNETNNSLVSPTSLEITPGPFVDLTPIALVFPDSVTAGTVLNFSYTIKNIGTKIAQGLTWSDRIYRSAIPVLDTALAVMVKSIPHSGILKPDSVYTVTNFISLANNQAPGNYYFFVLTDAGKNVYEATGEDNNTGGPDSTYIRPYPLDITVSAAVTQADTVMSGQTIAFNYTVNNVGPVVTTAGIWFDALYLSADTNLNTASDLFIGKWQHFGPLPAGSSGNIDKSINIPNGISGDYYLIVLTDMSNTNNDIVFTNNNRVLRNANGQKVLLHINLSPQPDLTVQSFSAPGQVFSGQQFKVYFTVKNNGVGQTQGHWIDKVYLSQDFEINAGDVLLGTHTTSLPLSPGDSYNDSLLITVNVPTSGNYVLIFKTDADNVIFEGSNELNNIQSSFLIVSIPPPGDLIVRDIQTDLNAVVGNPITVNWKIKNVGTNNLSGQLKDAIYFSKDSVFNPSLPVWKTYINAEVIPANGEINRSVSGFVPGLTPGPYYLFVRTDITNIFQETSEANNISHSQSTVNVDFMQLSLGIKLFDTLHNSENLFYKLFVPNELSGQTLVLTLKADSLNGVNQVYGSYNKVPGLISHDFSYRFPYKGNQELVIPVTKEGTYYFLVTGNSSASTHQNISLLANILEFEIRNLDRNYGGNTGTVTVLVNGSKFSPDMKIALLTDTNEIRASSVIFIDASQVVATFNLSTAAPLENPFNNPIQYGAQPGFYDVKAWKPSGEQFILHHGFEIIQGGTQLFLTNIQYPSQVRQNRYFTMSIQFANTGNVDIPIPARTLMSMQGAPIGFSTDDLVFRYNDLFLHFKEPGGSDLVLRPGAVSELKIYCRSDHRCVFKLLK